MSEKTLPSSLQNVPLHDIAPSPYQSRKEFDPEALQGLADSMRAEGLIEPIVVRTKGDAFELISGERRFRAAKLLGWDTIEAKVLASLGDVEAAAKGLIENLQRENLNPVEEADGIKDLLSMGGKYKLQDDLAKAIGKSKSYISRSLGLLELPDVVLDQLRRRNLERGHAIELTRINNTNKQKTFANKIIKNNWNVMETRTVIDELLGDGQAQDQSPAIRRPTNPRPHATDVKDPLASEWESLLGKLDLVRDIYWKAEYGFHQPAPQAAKLEGWYFFVSPMIAEDKKAALSSWFIEMGKALAGGKQDVPPTPPTETDHAMADGMIKPRLPRTAEEEKELEAIAVRGTPKDVYKWLYPNDSWMAEVAPKSWEMMNVSPAEGLRTVLSTLRKYAKQ